MLIIPRTGSRLSGSDLAAPSLLLFKTLTKCLALPLSLFYQMHAPTRNPLECYSQFFFLLLLRLFFSSPLNHPEHLVNWRSRIANRASAKDLLANTWGENLAMACASFVYSPSSIASSHLPLVDLSHSLILSVSQTHVASFFLSLPLSHASASLFLFSFVNLFFATTAAAVAPPLMACICQRPAANLGPCYTQALSWTCRRSIHHSERENG